MHIFRSRKENTYIYGGQGQLLFFKLFAKYFDQNRSQGVNVYSMYVAYIECHYESHLARKYLFTRELTLVRPEQRIHQSF